MRGKLYVTVAEAKGLTDTDTFGKNDPYVHMRLDENMQQQTTMLKNAGNNPMWNEKFTFEIKDEHTAMEVKVFDHDSYGKDDMIGSTQIPLTEVKACQNTDKIYTITNDAGEDQGKLHLILTFDEYGAVREGFSYLKEKLTGSGKKEKDGSSSSDEE
eukprot:TRINITY_DN81860_c0_g1_i1.p1 TRINITY_DN81860_c0_g1~~TRINITY_DN81860_c0_g1_i1.p1  ORF type:complete len:157 (-),score=27.64 TRINITY_DN81860_c0_g1_i1:43-513(-)